MTKHKSHVQLGVSFSILYARELGIDPKECLKSTLENLGVRRLRLMSYWPLHESKPRNYDFRELDWQIKLAEQHGADVSLCLGLRQPRWPESHWPEWAINMPEEDWQKHLFRYIEVVVNRYKDSPAVVSYQLENEAMLKRFGLNGDFNRKRLKGELKLIKELDPSRPVIMSMSDSWGIPWRGPKPDMYGFSIYRYFFDRDKFRHSKRGPFFYRLRAFLIRLKTGKKSFIHELQAEPWGPKATKDMTLEEQLAVMDQKHVKEMVRFAAAAKLFPIDIWGVEWWYYLKSQHNKSEIWDDMKRLFKAAE